MCRVERVCSVCAREKCRRLHFSLRITVGWLTPFVLLLSCCLACRHLQRAGTSQQRSKCITDTLLCYSVCVGVWGYCGRRALVCPLLRIARYTALRLRVCSVQCACVQCARARVCVCVLRTSLRVQIRAAPPHDHCRRQARIPRWLVFNACMCRTSVAMAGVVRAMAFSHDNAMVASGDTVGELRVRKHRHSTRTTARAHLPPFPLSPFSLFPSAFNATRSACLHACNRATRR